MYVRLYSRLKVVTQTLSRGTESVNKIIAYKLLFIPQQLHYLIAVRNRANSVRGKYTLQNLTETLSYGIWSFGTLRRRIVALFPPTVFVHSLYDWQNKTRCSGHFLSYKIVIYRYWTRDSFVFICKRKLELSLFSCY